MTYEITWESPSSVLVQFKGVVTFAGAERATNDLFGDSRCDDIEHVIWDFTTIDDFKVDAREVEEMAYTDFAASLYIEAHEGRVRYQRSQTDQFGEQYVRPMHDLGSPWENMLFVDIDDAKKWVEASR